MKRLTFSFFLLFLLFGSVTAIAQTSSPKELLNTSESKEKIGIFYAVPGVYEKIFGLSVEEMSAEQKTAMYEFASEGIQAKRMNLRAALMEAHRANMNEKSKQVIELKNLYYLASYTLLEKQKGNITTENCQRSLTNTIEKMNEYAERIGRKPVENPADLASKNEETICKTLSKLAGLEK